MKYKGEKGYLENIVIFRNLERCFFKMPHEGTRAAAGVTPHQNINIGIEHGRIP